MEEEQHHHHHHHHMDSAERFKQHQLRANRNRKIWSRFFFISGCVLAILIVIAVVWLYTNE